MGFELQKNLHIIEKHMVEYNYRVKLNQQFSRHIILLAITHPYGIAN